MKAAAESCIYLSVEAWEGLGSTDLSVKAAAESCIYLSVEADVAACIPIAAKAAGLRE